MNNFENLGFFAAAVTAGNIAGLSPRALKALSTVYVLVRAVYNVVYIFNDTMPRPAKGWCWLTGVGCCLTMFVMAGNKMRKALF